MVKQTIPTQKEATMKRVTKEDAEVLDRLGFTILYSVQESLPKATVRRNPSKKKGRYAGHNALLQLGGKPTTRLSSGTQTAAAMKLFRTTYPVDAHSGVQTWPVSRSELTDLLENSFKKPKSSISPIISWLIKTKHLVVVG